jgi:biopolymer transport protein ExbD
MAFKRVRSLASGIPLISFMDMCFLLLIFFVATSYHEANETKEEQLPIMTPKNQQGNETQFLIQFISPDTVLWLDQSASVIVKRYDKEGFDPEMQKQHILEALNRECRFLTRDFNTKLDALVALVKAEAGNRRYVLIRAPNNIPFSPLINTIGKLSGYSNLEYGLVGGSIDQIKNCRKITTVYEDNHENLVIDF